jgi:hypothetical protein
MPDVFILHGSSGFMDEGFYIVAVALAAVTVICLLVYGLHSRSPQPVAEVDSDTPATD